MAMSKEERNAKARARYAAKKALVYGPANLAYKQRGILYPETFTKAGKTRVKNTKLTAEQKRANARARYAAKKALVYGPVNLAYKQRGILYPETFTKAGKTRAKKMTAEEKRAKARARYAAKRLAQGKSYMPKN
jgi:hypothetical protein